MTDIVVGAGIVGLATARQLLLTRPGSSVTVIDKEPAVARHQTGHNSGVVHAGVYYTPGSLKATLCRRGVALLREYTAQRGIPYLELGKLVIAVDSQDEQRLQDVSVRARANGVRGLRMLGPNGISEIEPHATGRAALHSPHTAVVDFAEVARCMAGEIQELGGRLMLGATVHGVRQGSRVTVATSAGDVVGDRAVLCGGLHVDRLARMAGGDRSPRIVPFRGEYYELLPQRTSLVKGLIYPVPDPRYPFLGVHLTRRVNHTVDVGPNAVLALAREGYRRRDVSLADLRDSLAWRGFARLARANWRTGASEMAGSLLKRRFAAAARRYVPELAAADLRRAPAGVRAQAVDQSGDLLDDFRIERLGAVTAVRNAPSPAATSSMAIAEHIVAQLH